MRVGAAGMGADGCEDKKHLGLQSTSKTATRRADKESDMSGQAGRHPVRDVLYDTTLRSPVLVVGDNTLGIIEADIASGQSAPPLNPCELHLPVVFGRDMDIGDAVIAYISLSGRGLFTTGVYPIRCEIKAIVPEGRDQTVAESVHLEPLENHPVLVALDDEFTIEGDVLESTPTAHGQEMCIEVNCPIVFDRIYDLHTRQQALEDTNTEASETSGASETTDRDPFDWTIGGTRTATDTGGLFLTGLLANKTTKKRKLNRMTADKTAVMEAILMGADVAAAILHTPSTGTRTRRRFYHLAPAA